MPIKAVLRKNSHEAVGGLMAVGNDNFCVVTIPGVPALYPKIARCCP